jgi:hypothetical protein
MLMESHPSVVCHGDCWFNNIIVDLEDGVDEEMGEDGETVKAGDDVDGESQDHREPSQNEQLNKKAADILRSAMNAPNFMTTFMKEPPAWILEQQKRQAEEEKDNFNANDDDNDDDDDDDDDDAKDAKEEKHANERQRMAFAGIIDWQFAHLGPLLTDIAFLMLTSLPTRIRTENTIFLLTQYLEELWKGIAPSFFFFFFPSSFLCFRD